ncbi:MAG: hypothetical protein JXJ19_05295 [Elusimicrobia bacterium]|nr:hypothetical protein [Elusimicrobiota bacterium]
MAKPVRFKSLDELFKYWKKETVYYDELISLRDSYEKLQEIILKPFHEKIREIFEKDKRQPTPEEMDRYYNELSRDKMKILQDKYKTIMQEVEREYWE